MFASKKDITPERLHDAVRKGAKELRVKRGPHGREMPSVEIIQCRPVETSSAAVPAN